MPTKAQLIESGERLARTVNDTFMCAEKRDGYEYPIGEMVEYQPDFYVIAYYRAGEMMPAYHIERFSTLDQLIAAMRVDDLRKWSIVRFDE
jgi:hypothetical protein